MKNLKDKRTKIFPSTTRGGKELPSSSALDSPSVLSKLATPTPAIHSDMSHVIDDATSALHDTYNETTSMLDNIVSLVNFLMNNLLGLERMKLLKLIILMKVMMKILPLDMNCLLCLRVMLWMKKLLEIFLPAMIEVILKNIS